MFEEEDEEEQGVRRKIEIGQRRRCAYGQWLGWGGGGHDGRGAAHATSSQTIGSQRFSAVARQPGDSSKEPLYG